MFKPTQQEFSLLNLNGLPGYLIRERGFIVEDYVQNYTSSIEGTSGLKPRSIKKQESLKNLNTVLSDPLGSPYTMCISSEPNDLRAKICAASIMLKAHRLGSKTRWHTLIGGYKDSLRDKIDRRLDFLVLANVPVNATDQKLEKLRDLIEIYNHVPKVIVTTGGEPIKFFNRIGLALHYSLWIRSKRCSRTI